MLTHIIQLASFRYRSHLSEGYQKNFGGRSLSMLMGLFKGRHPAFFCRVYDLKLNTRLLIKTNHFQCIKDEQEW
jgi:hypothetical protein